ncbi:hypothetical protein EK21DRAFT_113333 [Setomelanomma holmii]|uniref:Uncharacterized protein n=1 Tax=Setomelanomma holmii TaxID=210430 RepID=A0A9P4LJ94_9PLEO|nr:hypothetical protein EK21DRAFT_113333 [Setomelanomma holmii]
MPRPLHPLLPKGPTETTVVPIYSPSASTLSPANFAPEVVESPVVTTTLKPLAANMAEFASTPTEPQPLPAIQSSSGSQSEVLDPHLDGMELDEAIGAAGVHMTPFTCGPPADSLPHCYQGTGSMSDWPSEIYNQRDTTWLLPPYSDQSSMLALVLRTEIQSHNTIREMLHSTEQRRLEAVQRCDQLETDNRSWAAAYNNLTATLGRWAEEFSRLTTENMNLKTELQIVKVQYDRAYPKA